MQIWDTFRQKIRSLNAKPHVYLGSRDTTAEFFIIWRFPPTFLLRFFKQKNC